MVYSPPTISLSEPQSARARADSNPLAPFLPALIPIPHPDPTRPLDLLLLLGVSPSPDPSAANPAFAAAAAADNGHFLGPTPSRMRSGLLFLTNSIWNDEVFSQQLLHALGLLDLFASDATPGAAFGNPTRNRSHTTSGAALHAPGTDGRMAQSPFLAPTPNEASSALYLLDNLMLNLGDASAHTTRHRALTYSGVAASIPEVPLAALGAPIAARTDDLFALPYKDLSVSEGLLRPVLLNDLNVAELAVCTHFENPNLGPTTTLLFDNLPPFMDAANLHQLLLGSAGFHRGVLAIRVGPAAASKMALVDCASVEHAMSLKARFDHLELVPSFVLYVAFAKVTPKTRLSQSPPGSGHHSLGSVHTSGMASYSTSSSAPPSASVPTGVPGSTPGRERSASPNAPPLTIAQRMEALVGIVCLLAPLSVDAQKVRSLVRNTAKFPKSQYMTSYGLLPDPVALRQFDSPKLRELRKVLENNEKELLGTSSPSPADSDEFKAMSQLELEELCLAMLDEIPELCYDHIGNTVVQKIFAVVESPLIKLMMVKQIAPYLTQLGIHKNGTWAIQKIINLCQQDYLQKTIIANSLKPYSAKLFNDQFGNYVLQCCLKFGSPFNDFIFETMTDNFLEISSGRFGARCIRTILETANDSKNPVRLTVSNEQLFLVAGLIVEYANELALNNNGSLLITWFLDTFNGCRGLDYDPRYQLLCNKFLPHLDKLCTHKLANLTILKLLNNRVDQRVRHQIMDAIFGPYREYDFNDYVVEPPLSLLESILGENQEHNAGPLFIFKIVSNPVLLTVGDEAFSFRYQQFIISQVKRVILDMKIVNLHPYKKLVEEIGLSLNRLNRSSSVGRKGKRGSGRNGGKTSPRNQGMVTQFQMNQSSMLPPSMGYTPRNGGTYDPYSNMPNNGYMPDGGMTPGDYQTPYFNEAPLNYQQDLTVMQQLEQLSLSSAALGYASNPGTPHPSNQHSLFF